MLLDSAARDEFARLFGGEYPEDYRILGRQGIDSRGIR